MKLLHHFSISTGQPFRCGWIISFPTLLDMRLLIHARIKVKRYWSKGERSNFVWLILWIFLMGHDDVTILDTPVGAMTHFLNEEHLSLEAIWILLKVAVVQTFKNSLDNGLVSNPKKDIATNISINASLSQKVIERSMWSEYPINSSSVQQPQSLCICPHLSYLSLSVRLVA